MSAPVYATLQQLADKLDKTVDQLPVSASEKLRMASRQIDSLLIGAVYAIDSSQMPTNSEQAEAIKNATLAQVAYWLSGYSTEHGQSTYNSVSIGSVTLSGRTSDKSDVPLVSPQAVFELQQCPGLFPISARVVG